MNAPRVRTDDYATSMAGALNVSRRAPNQKVRLLAAFDWAGDVGLSDEQAAMYAGLLDSCYWKRCGELRDSELIEFTEESRKGHAGVARHVSVITQAGRDEIRALQTEGQLP